MYGLSFFNGALEFKNAHRDTIDKDEHIGDTRMPVFHNKLIYYFE